MKRTDTAIFMESEEYQNLKATFEAEQRESFKKYQQEHKDTTIKGPSLYELNRQLINGLPNMPKSKIRDKVSLLESWFEKNPDKYFMLLCNDLNYFTIFHQCTTTFGSYTKMAEQILELAITSIGNIKTIEVDNNDVIAIWGWQKEEDELPHCFYLFPYGRGVIEV